MRITEIFFSLQGESNTVGLPTVFIRLTGCPLRCQYCDTQYAFKGGKLMTIPDILQQVSHYTTKYITVTGGEPLAQPDSLLLLTKLCEHGYIVSLETSGALDIALVDKRVIKVMDLKTPGSGEEHRNLYSNLTHITANDQIKFVICHRNDYEWAKEMCMQYKLLDKCEVLFSASFEEESSQELAQWILVDQLMVRFQLQMHKYLWGNQPGH